MIKGNGNYMKTRQEIVKDLNERKEKLTKARHEAEKRLVNAPEGKLRVSVKSRKIRYYEILSPDDTRGKYINKDKIKTAKKLADKDYCKKLIIAIKREIADIDRCLRILTSNHGKKNDIFGEGYTNAENIYSHLHDGRKELISPIIIDDEENALRWAKKDYKKSDYKPEEKVYPTKKGDMVRSKSEAMLADMYYDMGALYRYECELVLADGKCVYPDFTLLNKRTRQLIYHEHLGRLDDEKYRLKALRKLEAYRENGIYTAKNLFLTYEVDGCPLNIERVKKNVTEFLE